MKNCDCGCSSGCRLDRERPKGQAAIKDFRRKHPKCEPEACDRRKADQGKEFAE